MSIRSTTRRDFLASTVLVSAGAALGPSQASATPGAPDSFSYEVTRTDEEWRAMLTDIEYTVMREGGTEDQRTTSFWNSEEVGTYCCRGCDLPIYSSETKENLPIGWVFFRHSEPNAILTGIDPVNPYGETEMGNEDDALISLIEVHCRRCGSHLGHLVSLSGGPMHCINGSAMTFEAA